MSIGIGILEKWAVVLPLPPIITFNPCMSIGIEILEKWAVNLPLTPISTCNVCHK